MSSTSFLTNKGLELMCTDYWENTTLTAILLQNSYTPNKDHDFVNDIEGSEATATGYVRTTIAGKAATTDNVYDWINYTATNVSFGAIGGATNNTIRYVAIAEIKGGASSADPVVAILRMNDITTPASYTVVWNNPILRTAMG